MKDIFFSMLASVMKQKKVYIYSTRPLKYFIIISVLLIVLFTALLIIDKPDIEYKVRYDDKFYHKMQIKRSPMQC